MATTLLVVIGAASISHAAGLSAALGAFLAGLLLAESEYRHDIEIYIEPFKGLLLGLFFMSVAMGINLAEVAKFPVEILFSVIGLFLLKALITTMVARLYGFTWHHATETGVLLAQGGEFAFVVIGMALTFHLLPIEVGQFMLIVVSATMIATPFMATLSRKIGERLPKSNLTTDIADFEEQISDHVVLVGFGRTGNLLSQLLNMHHIPFLAIDQQAKSENVESSVLRGDATHSRTLQKLKVEQARAMVICINDTATTSLIIQTARRLAPQLAILVRAHDELQAEQLLSIGASLAVPAVQASGMQLAEALLEELDMPDHTAQEMVNQLRQQISN